MVWITEALKWVDDRGSLQIYNIYIIANGIYYSHNRPYLQNCEFDMCVFYTNLQKQDFWLIIEDYAKILKWITA